LKAIDLAWICRCSGEPYGLQMEAQIIPSTIWLLKCHYRFINSKQWWNYDQIYNSSNYGIWSQKKSTVKILWLMAGKSVCLYYVHPYSTIQ
jgi:hypothetical protein